MIRSSLDGLDLAAISGRRLRIARRNIQPVFQDPAAALNPRRTVLQLLSQAITLTSATPQHPLPIAIAALESVELYPSARYLTRYPHELSGGQKQRLAIARAIAARPKLIIADEPLSGADVSIRGHILNLLIDLQKERQLGYLFITHDISIARAFAHRVLVMHKGEIVESGQAGDVIDNPTCDYTRRLIASVPRIDV